MGKKEKRCPPPKKDTVKRVKRQLTECEKIFVNHISEERASRWRKSKMRRSTSSPQIHQKYNYMWNNSYRTPTARWQKTSDLPKGKKLPTYLSRAKEKRKNRDKRIGMGPRQWEGAVKEERFPHTRKPLRRRRLRVAEGVSFGATEESAATGVRRAKRRGSRTEDQC